MLIRGAVVPALLLLLLHEVLAQQACLNISNYDLHIYMENGNIMDRRQNRQSCTFDSLSCIFLCANSGELQFNGSSECFSITVTNGTTIPSYKYQFHADSGNFTCTLYMCFVETIYQLMQTLSCSNCGQEEFLHLITIRDSCSNLFHGYPLLQKHYLNIEKQLIHKIMEKSQPIHGTKEHNLKMLLLDVVNISDAVLNSLDADRTIQIKVPELFPENMPFIPQTWLPIKALRTIPEDERIIGVVSYINHSSFQLDQERISSKVIRIELLGQKRLQNLNPPLNIKFTVNQTYADNESTFLCHYFHETDYVWKTDGCETLNDTDQIICNCNHTTPFSVLLTKTLISEAHWNILSMLSYMGCGLSAFFSALSFVIYVYSRNSIKMDYSTSIHVSLSGALFLLNVTFLMIEWGSSMKLDWVCEFLAALMHYSLLSCFTWMAIEALHLYLMLIKVFNTYYKHYLLKLSLIGWGIPGVIVATSLGVRNFHQFYGKTELMLADTTETQTICWITDETFFYSLNLTYFTTVFFFNSAIFMVVASRIWKMQKVLKPNSRIRAECEGKSHGNHKRFTDTCRSIITLIGLTCLLGTTWGLAFLGSGYVNYPILYLFCILNSLQGFFIFLWICLSTKKQKMREMEEKLSTPVRTSGIKSD